RRRRSRGQRRGKRRCQGCSRKGRCRTRGRQESRRAGREKEVICGVFRGSCCVTGKLRAIRTTEYVIRYGPHGKHVSHCGPWKSGWGIREDAAQCRFPAGREIVRALESELDTGKKV